MESLGLVAILICILLAATISRRIQNTAITLPMVYTLFGIILGVLVLDIIHLTPEDHLVEFTAELTLVIVLATDALRIDVRGLMRDHNLPARLLGIGLPLSMILGTVAAILIFTDLSIWEAIIMSIILAPTDASLSQSVVNNPKVPVRIRQTLNVEGGLNDGIALPFLLLAIAMAESEVVFSSPFGFFLAASGQIIFGIVAGLVIGYLGTRFIQWGQRSGWMSMDYQKISSLALILLAFGLAEFIGGNGFIAAFCFGLISGNVAGEKETEVTVLILLTFMLFGGVMLPHAIGSVTPAIIIYALLSLVLVRTLSVAVSMIGTNVHRITTLFMGWFGPRGIASILYVFIVMESEQLPGLDLIYAVVMITVLFSIFAHGITAALGAARYATAITKMELDQVTASETKDVSEMPLRAGTS